MPPLSAVILTKDEEHNIERCLKSVVSLCDEVIVVDCYSQDKTVEIAKNYTDKVYLNEWPGFAEQRIFGLSKTRNDWILWIDADEEVSPELDREIRNLDFESDSYIIPMLIWYLGRWIRHCGWYPGHKVRLFDKTKGQFNDVRVHEHFSTGKPAPMLKHPMYHYSYRNLRHHLDKINLYTSLAGRQMHEKGKNVTISSAMGHAVSRFLKTFIIKCGFLDGRQGLIISILASYYTFLKYAKCWELNHDAAPFKDLVD